MSEQKNYLVGIFGDEDVLLDAVGNIPKKELRSRRFIHLFLFTDLMKHWAIVAHAFPSLHFFSE